MKIELKKRKIIEIVKAIESISESDIEFESYKTVHDLALNKKVLEPHFEALRILDKPCTEFKEYQKQLSKIRLHNESDHVKLKEESLRVTKEFEAAIDKEADRQANWIEELESVVTVENLRQINANEIKGKSGQVLKFLTALQPLITFKENSKY